MAKHAANSYVEGILILLIVVILIAILWPVFRGYRDKVAAERARTPVTTPQQ